MSITKGVFTFARETARLIETLPIPIKRLDPAAIIPTRAHEGDAGYDLYALDGGLIEPGKRLLLRTGIAMAIPAGYYGRIAPRSGLAVKQGMDVLAGVCDSVYRGDVGVLLLNTSDKPVSIAPRDRIAQLIIERCYTASFEEIDDLPSSARGGAGFGSTGI